MQLIILKQKIDLPPQPQQPTQSSNSNVLYVLKSKQLTESLLNTTKILAASKSQNIKTVITDLSKNDNINPPKSTISKLKALNKSEPIIIPNQIIPVSSTQGLERLNSTLDFIDSNSNDLEEIEAIDTSVMNIKITNVTSLPPEVFESVPDVCEDITLHKNTIDNLLLANTTLEQLVTHVPSAKRSVYEGILRKKKLEVCAS